MPVWQIADAPTNASIVNFDLFSRSSFEHRAFDVMQGRSSIISDACDFTYLSESFLTTDSAFPTTFDISESSATKNGKDVLPPFGTYLLTPVYDSFNSDSSVVAFLISAFTWSKLIIYLLPSTEWSSFVFR